MEAQSGAGLPKVSPILPLQIPGEIQIPEELRLQGAKRRREAHTILRIPERVPIEAADINQIVVRLPEPTALFREQISSASAGPGRAAAIIRYDVAGQISHG